jgi:hypothetical protein
VARFDDKQAEALTRKTREWSKTDKRELDDAVQAMLLHRSTRKYLYWLMDIGKAIGQNPFTGDALTTAFECGQQNVGQQVMAHLIEVAPDGFLALLKEVGDERSRRDTELNKLRDAGTGADTGDGSDTGG